jgi:hypothetical protein
MMTSKMGVWHFATFFTEAFFAQLEKRQRQNCSKP